MHRFFPSVIFTALSLSACSGGGTSDVGSLDNMSRRAAGQGIAEQQGDVILIASEAVGPHMRIIHYADSNINRAEIYQLTRASIRNGSPSFRIPVSLSAGHSFVGEWRDGQFFNLMPVAVQSREAIQAQAQSAYSGRREYLPLLSLALFAPDELDDTQKQRALEIAKGTPDPNSKDGLWAPYLDLNAIYKTLVEEDGKISMNVISNDEQGVHLIHSNEASSNVIVIINAQETAQNIPMNKTARLRLHPVQIKGNDGLVRQSQIRLNSVVIPPLTTAIFVRQR